MATRDMSAIHRLDQFDFHQRLAATPGVALVLFSARACGACRRLHGVLAQEEWPGVTLFEVDAGDDAALAQEFEVAHLPALHLYRDGCYHAPVAAEAAPAPLRRAMAEALSAPAREAP